jgi:hypothetical protein
MMEAIIQRMPDVELATAEPLARSITGIEAMPVTFTPSRRVKGG